jgi:hypothetical protein
MEIYHACNCTVRDPVRLWAAYLFAALAGPHAQLAQVLIFKEERKKPQPQLDAASACPAV